MNFYFVIPLSIFFLALIVSLNTDGKTFDGIPSLIAPFVGVIALIWFFAIIPWLFKAGCVLILLSLSRIYLPDTLRMLK
ncbi:MAG: hypothetical protein QNJ68_14045 [Microcoleaceae cyanobacterium MO_207.B10]|nr:hypothetical protein [Microcoleaceae cyanobacterium MO_207.B10]